MPDRMPEDMPDRMPEICQIECQKVCQIECQKICQIECQIECQKVCQIECQIECQKVCQIKCQSVCQMERQEICQIECQIECQNICQIEMPDRVPEDMPEDMPGRMPEDMPDRMPECQIECQISHEELTSKGFLWRSHAFFHWGSRLPCHVDSFITDGQKVLQALRCPGNGYFCDGIVKFEGVLTDGQPGTILAMQIGASRFVNSYPGARRGPNAAFRVKTTCGPNSGAVELVVRTANSVGIASKQEILLHYGMHFDLSRQMSDFFSTPKVVGHNRVPSKHSYYWVTEPLMRYLLEKLFGCCF